MATNETVEDTGGHPPSRSSTPMDSRPSIEEASPEVADLEADIERTRADLADTVDKLAAKLDVKTRVRNSVADAKDNATTQLRRLQDRATDDEGRPTPATLGIGGAIAALVAVLIIIVWRRNSTPTPPRWR